MDFEDVVTEEDFKIDSNTGKNPVELTPNSGVEDCESFIQQTEARGSFFRVYEKPLPDIDDVSLRENGGSGPRCFPAHDAET